jgi:hypothetical protein
LEVSDKVAGSKKCRGPAGKREDVARREREDAKRRERESMKRDERTRAIGTAVRLVLMIWDIVWTIVRERMKGGTGPGRLL